MRSGGERGASPPPPGNISRYRAIFTDIIVHISQGWNQGFVDWVAGHPLNPPKNKDIKIKMTSTLGRRKIKLKLTFLLTAIPPFENPVSDLSRVLDIHPTKRYHITRKSMQNLVYIVPSLKGDVLKSAK